MVEPVEILEVLSAQQLQTKLEEFAKIDPLVARLNKLPLGAILTYEEICCILEEPTLAGNSRKAQRKRWNKYMVLETVGRKLFIKQVFSPQDFLIEQDFRSDEEHLYNSSLLLQEYLLKMVGAAEETSIQGIYSFSMFNKDIAILCGYVPEKYYNYRRQLEKGGVYGAGHPKTQNYFTKAVKTEVCDTIRKLLASLEKKKLLVIKKVHVGIDRGMKSILKEEEVVQYNSLLLSYAREVNKGKLQGLNTNTQRFKDMLRSAGLEYINVYTGFQIFFKEEDLRTNLEFELKQQMVDHNNSLFKGRVRRHAERDNVKAWAEKRASSSQFLQDAFYSTESMNEIDWMLEEFLTYGTCSSWGEESEATTSL